MQESPAPASEAHYDAAAANATTTSPPQPTLDEFRAMNAELQRRRLDAEKDRDFFREQYSRASAHAGEVARENSELHERAVRAEGQLRDGLGMLRGVYEERVGRLEAEVAKWRGRCGVLEGRDRRTDDEVRRRAALEPELQAENGRLRASLEDALAQLAEWQSAQESESEVLPGTGDPSVSVSEAAYVVQVLK